MIYDTNTPVNNNEEEHKIVWPKNNKSLVKRIEVLMDLSFLEG